MPKKNPKKLYILAGTIAAIILLIFFNSLGWLQGPKNVFYKASVPVFRPFKFVGGKIAGYFKVAISLKDLLADNARLQKENKDLTLAAAKFFETAEENKFLRAQLGAVPPLRSKMADADLIGFEPGNLGSRFLVNRGKDDGVEPGFALIFAGGFLVGKVSEVQANFSKAVALTDPDSAVFALTQDSRVGGVAKGDHGVGIILDMVPQEKEIKIGEIVASSGLDARVPKGLVIGTVEEKISSESEIFQKFKIKPSVNYKEIEEVFVVLGND